jgi:hypothetical protein
LKIINDGIASRPSLPQNVITKNKSAAYA